MYLFNMGHWISWWAMIDKKKDAIVNEGCHYTYPEFNERINKMSNALREKFNIQKGDRVGCLLRNCNEFLEILMACAKIGARFVPVNIRLAAREVEHVMNDSGMKIYLQNRHLIIF